MFAYLLTLADNNAAGRAYGGVYIIASLIRLWVIKGVRPDRRDAMGTVVWLIGASIVSTR